MDQWLPLTTLFGSVIWAAIYFTWGRVASAHEHGRKNTAGLEGSIQFAVLKAASHCGAGCTLGDILAEGLAAVLPGILLFLGWQHIFIERTFAIWILDYIIAFVVGIAFQYFSIQPMRHLPVKAALIRALKADALSITAWQVGMYGLMAVAQFWLFRTFFGGDAVAAQPEFWFAMQLAMLCGFVTSYPVNWLLIRIGVKERM